MEDNVDVIMENVTTLLSFRDKHATRLGGILGGLTASVYGLWAVFVFPGFCKVPWRLRVPFLPSSKAQVQNVMKLLEDRKGRLVDLGSGDGRLVLAAASRGFQSTGYELNSILLAYAKTRRWWLGIPANLATFMKQDLWMADLSGFSNVTVFLAPGLVTRILEKKLKDELPDDARIIVCRFPFTHWPATCSEGSGLDQVWAYDIQTIKKQLPKSK
ncbi:ATP synthase subunit C lysine N-methyltransferase-like isoform X1 [Protopterus annectens]|uniref:ATP synthase subunit C lysine N-methyltransferase-like isoform X1 n=1 Tax=Protopterus annectens TaxID=7888 RepID=UPI001CFB79B2|nr:ATP synthase subunit C lysine N-methyltransferase-like isoform X1 [Protopterus annectens]